MDEPVVKTVAHSLRLRDGRTLFIHLPEDTISYDDDGRRLFGARAVRLIDRARALAIPVPEEPTPGYMFAIRDALGLTHVRFW